MDIMTSIILKHMASKTFELEEESAESTVKGLTHGFYEIYWRSGGSSLASVGYDSTGNNWLAPCNWISGSTTDWSDVSAYKMLLANDYSRKTKDIATKHQKVFISLHDK